MRSWMMWIGASGVFVYSWRLTPAPPFLISYDSWASVEVCPICRVHHPQCLPRQVHDWTFSRSRSGTPSTEKRPQQPTPAMSNPTFRMNQRLSFADRAAQRRPTSEAGRLSTRNLNGRVLAGVLAPCRLQMADLPRPGPTPLGPATQTRSGLASARIKKPS